MVYQEEICPDTGSLHLQGYVEFRKTMRLGGLKKLPYMSKVHWEKRKGTREEAKAYCEKEDTRNPDAPLQFEFGNFDAAGRGNNAAARMANARDAIKGGANLAELAEDPEMVDLAFRYHAAIDKLHSAYAKPEPRDTYTVLCFGPPGMSPYPIFFSLLYLYY